MTLGFNRNHKNYKFKNSNLKPALAQPEEIRWLLVG